MNTDSSAQLVAGRIALLLILGISLLVRANFVVPVFWEQPYDVHHQDEHFLTLEALALWEGVTPTEIGWPASTLRLVLSAAYGTLMLHDSGGVIVGNDAPVPQRMDAIATWTLAQYRDPTQLYVIGRWVSVVTGVLQIVLIYWALRRWHSPLAGLLAAAMAAISPLAVRYSQFVLADITGVLMVTALLGVLAAGYGPYRIRPLLAGALLGAAAASKYHFGLWLVAGVVACYLAAPREREASRNPMHEIAWFVAGVALVFLTLVPWLWLNPVLWVKEMIETVLSRAVQPPGSRISRGVANLTTTFGELGTVVFVGLLPGLWLAVHRLGRYVFPVLLVLLAGVLVIASAGLVFDRWGLFMLPAFLFFSAIGYAELLTSRSRLLQGVAVVALVFSAGVTLRQLVLSQQFVGRLDSHGRAHAWLTSHLPPGSRIAVHSEYSRRLPRTSEQLRSTLEQLSGPQAYKRKVTINGLEPAPPLEPMRLAVLNMELFWSHWWRRELAAGAPGYDVTLYNDEPRYEGVLTEDAVAEFVKGLTTPDAGFDALLLNRNRTLPVAPAVVFRGQPGETLYLYVRPGGPIPTAVQESASVQ